MPFDSPDINLGDLLKDEELGDSDAAEEVA